MGDDSYSMTINYGEYLRGSKPIVRPSSPEIAAHNELNKN